MNHSAIKSELRDLIRVTIVLGNVLMRRKFELRNLHVFMGLKVRVVEASRRVNELEPQGKPFESLVNSIDKMTVNEFHFNLLQRILFSRGNWYINPPLMLVSNKPGEAEKRYVYEICERLGALKELV